MIPFIPKELEENVNVSSEHPLGELAKLLGGVILLCVLAYFGIGLLIDLCLPLIPFELEASLANVYASQLFVKPSLKAENDPLQSILNRLQATDTKTSLPCKVFLVPSPTVNAVALPGGHILVFTGLYEKLKSDNAIAFVLAHELGHIAHRDHLRAFGRSLVINLITASVFGENSFLSSVSAQSNQVVMAQYSQQQETAADEYALSALNRSEHHVQGALDVFTLFQSLENDQQSKLSFLSTHPLSTNRLNHTKQLIQKNAYSL